MEQNMDTNDVRIQPSSHRLEKTSVENQKTIPKNPPPKTEGDIQPIKKAELEELAQKEFNEFVIQPLKTKDTVEKIAIRKKLMEVLGSAIYPLHPETAQVVSKNEIPDLNIKRETEVLKTKSVEIKKPPKEDTQLNLREMLETIEQINNLTSKLKRMISETYGVSSFPPSGIQTAPPPPPPPPPMATSSKF